MRSFPWADFILVHAIAFSVLWLMMGLCISSSARGTGRSIKVGFWWWFTALCLWALWAVVRGG